MPQRKADARSLFLMLAACLGLAMLTGCASSQDVTNDRRYPTAYRAGEIYETRVGAVVRNAGDTCMLYPVDDPPNTAELAEPIVQSLPPGTRIRLERLVHTIVRAPIQGESYVEVFVTIVGQSSGCERIRIGNGWSTWAVFTAPNGWPTVIGSPDPGRLTVVPPTVKGVVAPAASRDSPEAPR